MVFTSISIDEYADKNQDKSAKIIAIYKWLLRARENQEIVKSTL